jgi:transcription-repair coupling factor (superfamily II helicase)
VHDFHSTAPPEFRLDARAAQPLAPLTSFLSSYTGRVLIAADSPGRREVIVEMLSAHGRRPRALQSWEQFASGDARLAICVAEDVAGLALARRRCCCSANRSCSARARARSGGGGAARCRIRPRSCAICRAWSPARRWCMRPTAWAAMSACS